jgi:alkylresorcinol/alkylpyrone synthase
MAFYIRSIYTPRVGVPWSNSEMLDCIREHLETDPSSDREKCALFDKVRLFLIGERYRSIQCEEFISLRTFSEHAAAFEDAVQDSVNQVAREIKERVNRPQFDAIIGVSSVGQLLPGIAERVLEAVPEQMSRGALVMDIGNGGCTASSRAVQLVYSLNEAIRNAIIVVCEPTSTLADGRFLSPTNWKGICSFGDGAAGVWVSREPGDGAIEISGISTWHGKESDLIRWDFGEYYHRFGISDSKQFDAKVRRELLDAMTHIQRNESPGGHWALHPAGMMLLVMIARELGVDRGALEPSVAHFRKHSNMSSASILHILESIRTLAQCGEEIRWLSMGAGFHVAYGTGVRL